MFSLSPSIQVREFDLSTVIPQVSTSITGVVIDSEWGPAFEIKTTTNEREMVEYWGLPTNSNAEKWYGANEFLRYGNILRTVRAVDATTAKNAGIICQDDTAGAATADIGTALYIPNTDSVPTMSFATNEKIKFCAKYPGTLGNSKIKLALCNASDFASAEILDGTTFLDEFEYAPVAHDTYDYQDGIAIAVLVQNDLDTNWVIQEKWNVSLDPNSKDSYNRSNYLENVINEKSQWIYAFDNTTIEENPSSFEATLLTGGAGDTPSVSDALLGYDLFENAEEVDINILIDGGWNDSVTHGYILDIAEERMDCIAICTIPRASIVDAGDVSTVTNACVTYRNTTLNKNTSYGALYSGWKQILDKYNEVKRWVPMSGDIAGIFARTDKLREPWYAPAGLNRGTIRNIIKLAYSPKKSYRDLLYKNSINPIVGLTGEGTVIWGQKTLLSQPSAFDRINVRRLFIVLEKAISTASRSTLFEFNDAYQRSLFVMMVDPFLRSVQGRRGIQDYHIVCDDSNNPGSVIDSNAFVGDIYIKPARVIEFIQLNFFAVNSDVDFSEVIRPDYAGKV